MGAEPSKPQAKQMDMNDVVFQLKMSAKRFDRERKKCEKEKDKNLKKAEKCLQKGDEEGARLFVMNAQKNITDRMKYLQMSSRLESMASTLKSNHSSNEIMGHLSQNVTPILAKQSEQIPLNEMVKNFEKFQESYDKMQITTNIMSNNFDKMNMGNNQVKSSDELFNQVKAKVNFDMGKEMGVDPIDTTQTTTTNQKQEEKPEEAALDDYINNLRNL